LNVNASSLKPPHWSPDLQLEFERIKQIDRSWQKIVLLKIQHYGYKNKVCYVDFKIIYDNVKKKHFG
jgi:hypothetical protein